MRDLPVTNLHFSPAPPAKRPSGLLGWLRFDVGDALRLDGVTLRRTLDGRLTLSYPGRRDARDLLHSLVRPLDDEIRRTIERQVFSLLGQEILQ